MGLALAGAAVCFLVDALAATYFVAGVAGTAALAVGLSRWVGPVWAAIVGMPAGAALMWLNSVTRLARRMKQ